jgi:hypothetical protein
VNDRPIDDRFGNIDDRLERIEQYLPSLATRAELHAAIAPLATRAELHAAIAPLATREEVYAAITAEGERSRLHATLLYEDVRDDIRIILEHMVTLSARVEELAQR